jgi:transposase
LAQSVAPGSSASLACRMHGISSGQLYTWRRQFRTGELTGFAPVLVVPPVNELPAATAAIDPVPPGGEADRPTGGLIEVELPSGVKLRISGAVDAAVLRQVLSALS